MTRAPGELLPGWRVRLRGLEENAAADQARGDELSARSYWGRAAELRDCIEALEREVRDAAQAQSGVGPEIAAFALDMQRELDANAHKGAPGSWRECSPEWLWSDTMYHAAKMIYAMKHGEADKVREFAADVANMAMMTRDAYLAQAGAGSEGQGEGA